AFGIGADAEHHAVVGDAAAVPVAVPQVRVDRGVERVGAFDEGRMRAAVAGADAGPQAQRVGAGQRQPAGYAAALPADHVHRVAPVALGDVAQAATIALLQQPVHGPVHALGHRRARAVAAGHHFVQRRVVAGLVQVGLQAYRQPHAVVGVRHLVDVLQLRAFDQQDAVGHGAVVGLLGQRV